MYRTQKARGVEAGFSLANEAGNGYRVAVALAVMPHAEPETLVRAFDRVAKNGRTLFARPCPIVPKHGFVESRVVANMEELEQVYRETIEQEPLGEVLLMERLSGKYSGIMTATGMSWGLGNDGVTAGKGEQRIVPAPSGNFDNMFLPMLGVDPTKSDEGVYIELVEETGVMCVVQMRLGPKQPDSRLKRICVGTHPRINWIVKPARPDDLLLWDKQLRGMASKNAQSLVWLPGQTMASHFAVQAIAQGFNVSIEDKCPVEPGNELQPDKNELIPLGEKDFSTLAHYIKQETKTIFWDYPRECLLSVAVLHALPYWDNTDWLLKLRARGVVAAARFSLAAVLGEARHKPTNAPEVNGENPVQVPWAELMGDELPHKHSRSYVFLKAFGVPWEKCAAYAKAAAADHVIGGWDDVMTLLAKGKKLADVHAGYRGPKWEWAALKCHDLCNALDKFVADPNKDNWGMILGFYNEIINAAHNGGYLLNKWVGQGLIDNVAVSPSLAFGYPQVMNLVWGETGGLPGQAWLPMNMFTKKQADLYSKYGDGVLIHNSVVEHLKKVGKFTSAGTPMDSACKCKYCMQSLWSDVGAAALFLGQPCYVPVDQLGNMPYSVIVPKNAAVDDPYSASAASALKPNEPQPIPMSANEKPAEVEDEGEDDEDNG